MASIWIKHCHRTIVIWLRLKCEYSLQWNKIAIYTYIYIWKIEAIMTITIKSVDLILKIATIVTNAYNNPDWCPKHENTVSGYRSSSILNNTLVPACTLQHAPRYLRVQLWTVPAWTLYLHVHCTCMCTVAACTSEGNTWERCNIASVACLGRCRRQRCSVLQDTCSTAALLQKCVSDAALARLQCCSTMVRTPSITQDTSSATRR